MAREIKKYSLEFGKKEKVLNYACQTYQLSRPNKVGGVMELIRECQPKTIDEWEKWYFERAYTENTNPIKITPEILQELGERLYEKITKVVIPEWTAAFQDLTLKDCIDYIHNLRAYFSDNFRRITCSNVKRGYIVRHYGTCTNNSSFSYCHPL